MKQELSAFMKRISLFQCSFLITCIFLNSISAQENLPGTDSVFGFDQLLYNGRVYTYQVPRNAKGSPMLFETGFELGTLTVQGNTYKDLALNYDVFNQLLLLKYIDHKGSTTILSVSESRVGGFTIGRSCFEMNYQPGSKPVISQFFKADHITVRYYWRKTLKLDNTFGTQVFVFSVPLREQTVTVDGREQPYRKNKEFIKAFKPSVQENINNYLKVNKIKILKVSDAAITDLISYCNTQLAL